MQEDGGDQPPPLPCLQQLVGFDPEQGDLWEEQLCCKDAHSGRDEDVTQQAGRGAGPLRQGGGVVRGGLVDAATTRERSKGRWQPG